MLYSVKKSSYRLCHAVRNHWDRNLKGLKEKIVEVF